MQWLYVVEESAEQGHGTAARHPTDLELPRFPWFVSQELSPHLGPPTPRLRTVGSGGSALSISQYRSLIRPRVIDLLKQLLYVKYHDG